MSKEWTFFDWLLAFVFIAMFGAFDIALYGGALFKFWGWFITSSFGIPLSLGQAVGVSVLVSFAYLTHNSHQFFNKTEDGWYGLTFAFLSVEISEEPEFHMRANWNVAHLTFLGLIFWLLHFLV